MPRLPTLALPVVLNVPVTLAPVVVATSVVTPLGARLILPDAAVINTRGPVSVMLPVRTKLPTLELPDTVSDPKVPTLVMLV